MINRVLILSIQLGGGHLRAGQAIETAFAQLDRAPEVRLADTMEYTNKVFRTLFLNTYTDMVRNAPEIYGWLYDRFDTPWKARLHRNILEKLNTRPVLRLLEEYRPDLIICTHVLPAGILSWLGRKGRVEVPQAIVITDLDVHAMWLCDYYAHYFVGLEEMKVHLEVLGVPPGKVSATGIPIDPVFAQGMDKAEARRQLGLDPERTTILVTGGSWGLGPMDKLVRAFEGVRTPVQIVAVCGMNSEMKGTLDRIADKWPAGSAARVKVIGWTDRMHVFMSAADLHAGKSGGLTTSEALAKGLPCLIVNPIRGQEERNADHLLEEGAAIRCNNLPLVPYKVDKLLNDPDRLARMRDHARRLGRPQSALDIVHKVAQLSERAQD